jgi:hypothetical protein
MSHTFSIDNVNLFVFEANKQSYLSQKAYYDAKINKKIDVINSYENFHNVISAHKNNYYYLNEKVVKNKNFSGLAIKVNLSSSAFKIKEVSLSESSLFSPRKSESPLRVMGNQKSGVLLQSKNLIGVGSKNDTLLHLKNTLSYKDILLKEKNVPLVSNRKNSLFNISFPSIKYNFAKSKKRRQVFGEVNVNFIVKKYEKNRKDFKTKNIN